MKANSRSSSRKSPGEASVIGAAATGQNRWRGSAGGRLSHRCRQFPAAGRTHEATQDTFCSGLTASGRNEPTEQSHLSPLSSARHAFVGTTLLTCFRPDKTRGATRAYVRRGRTAYLMRHGYRTRWAVRCPRHGSE